MTEQSGQKQQAATWEDELDKFPKKFNYHYSNPSTSPIQSQNADIDYTQYTCTDCGKKGVCGAGAEVFMACICQECFDKLWTEYIEAVTKPHESEG